MTSSNRNQNTSNNDALQKFSKTCSMIYSRINRKQFEYLQAMAQVQEDILGSCNGLVKNQVDLIEEYSKKGIVSQEQITPIIQTINEYIEWYVSYLSLEYELVVSRLQLHHRTLSMMNDYMARLTQIIIQSLKSFENNKKE